MELLPRFCRFCVLQEVDSPQCASMVGYIVCHRPVSCSSKCQRESRAHDLQDPILEEVGKPCRQLVCVVRQKSARPDFPINAARPSTMMASRRPCQIPSRDLSKYTSCQAGARLMHKAIRKVFNRDISPLMRAAGLVIQLRGARQACRDIAARDAFHDASWHPAPTLVTCAMATYDTCCTAPGCMDGDRTSQRRAQAHAPLPSSPPRFGGPNLILQQPPSPRLIPN